MRFQSCFVTALAAVLLPAATFGADVTVTRSQSASAARQTREAVVAYWTAERMKNARPYDIVREGTPAARQEAAAGAAAGAPGFVTSSADGRTSVLLAGREPVSGAIDTTANGYDYAPPENTFAIPASWYGSFGIRNVGKVFFSHGGFDFVCSGAAIGGRGVLTAGHCLSDGQGTFHDNWIFVPAYKNGTAPFGVWAQFDAIVFTAWHFSSILCRDVGAAVVFDNNGLTLSQAIGNFGFAWNQPQVLAWSNHGYPADTPWTGEIQAETDASYSRLDNPDGCTPATQAMGTRQTAGMSGGPWILVYRPQNVGANNYVNGVNSYVYTTPNHPNEIFSPYIDDTVKTSIFDWAVSQ